MNWREKSVLVSCRVYLLENIYDVNHLLDDFIQAGIINTDEEEEITVKPTRLARKQTFFQKLPEWGHDAFRIFLKSLERNHYAAVAEKLQLELKNHHVYGRAQGGYVGCTEAAPPWLSSQVGKMPVSETVLHLLSQDLPPEQLFILGSMLGHQHSRLQHFQAAHPHTPSLQLSAMLCDWKVMSGNQASVEKLVSSLIKARVREDVYRDIILEDMGIIGQQKSDLINRMDSMSCCPSGRPEQWV